MSVLSVRFLFCLFVCVDLFVFVFAFCGDVRAVLYVLGRVGFAAAIIREDVEDHPERASRGDNCLHGGKKAQKQQKPLNVMSEMGKQDEISKKAIVYLESMMTGNFTMADAIK